MITKSTDTTVTIQLNDREDPVGKTLVELFGWGVYVYPHCILLGNTAYTLRLDVWTLLRNIDDPGIGWVRLTFDHRRREVSIHSEG